MENGTVEIDALDNESGKPLRYWVLNDLIHKAADGGAKHIVVKNVLGQRFIGACMEHKDLLLEIHGTPGNDLGVFMSGPRIEVFGNCEDQIGNTMDHGEIVVHGNAWDVTGLAARGGKILVRGNGGYRIGIHMKAYEEASPVVVYGGGVKEFFGEYMAGGTLVALGMRVGNGTIKDLPPEEIVRGSIGCGMHGGAIYIRGDVSEHQLGVGASIRPFTEEDSEMLRPILKEFSKRFGVPMETIESRGFTKIAPASSRPFGAYYNPRSV
jgi:glutamate synthase domain-containing protein 3